MDYKFFPLLTSRNDIKGSDILKRILVFLLVLSIFITPVYAQSSFNEKALWDLLGMTPPETTESYSDRYLAGYQDGYNAGYKSGFASGLEQAAKQASSSIDSDSSVLTEQSPPISGHIFLYPKEKRVAPLTIETSGEGYYYFVLTKFGSTKKTMSFFSHGGDTIRIKVPLGTYKIYYATGSTWYGVDDLFGDDTVYKRCGTSFAFTQDNDGYSGWTLTLYPVEDGNMDSTVISADEFPK